MTKVTLDTNMLHEYWKSRPKVRVVEEVLRLAREGLVDLAVTRRVRDDIPDYPLAQRINELPELRVSETGTVARWGESVWDGPDMWGADDFLDFSQQVTALATRRGQKSPDWRDWDHLHGHLLLHRDIFLTWDKGILALATGLKQRFGIVVMRPEEYLQSTSA